MKQPESGRGCPVGDIVLDGTPQVTALADAKAQDNRDYAADLHRDLLARTDETPARSSPPGQDPGRVRTANQPASTGLELAENQEA